MSQIIIELKNYLLDIERYHGMSIHETNTVKCIILGLIDLLAKTDSTVQEFESTIESIRGRMLNLNKKFNIRI